MSTKAMNEHRAHELVERQQHLSQEIVEWFLIGIEVKLKSDQYRIPAKDSQPPCDLENNALEDRLRLSEDQNDRLLQNNQLLQSTIQQLEREKQQMGQELESKEHRHESLMKQMHDQSDCIMRGSDQLKDDIDRQRAAHATAWKQVERRMQCLQKERRELEVRHQQELDEVHRGWSAENNALEQLVDSRDRALEEEIQRNQRELEQQKLLNQQADPRHVHCRGDLNPLDQNVSVHFLEALVDRTTALKPP